MIEVEFLGGEDISSAAKKLITGTRTNGSCFGSFNGVELVAYIGTEENDIINYYHDRFSFNQEAYKQSREYKKAQLKEKRELEAANETKDKLMLELPKLKFSDRKDILRWLCEFMPISDGVGVKIDAELVMEIFAAYSLFPDANCGDDFKEDDKNNYADYIIGQALSGLKSHGAIHHMILTFSKKWNKKFS